VTNLEEEAESTVLEKPALLEPYLPGTTSTEIECGDATLHEVNPGTFVGFGSCKLRLGHTKHCDCAVDGRCSCLRAKAIQEERLELFRPPFVTGSRAYGTPRPDSDLDVVVLISTEEAKTQQKLQLSRVGKDTQPRDIPGAT
jgi:hypothetical protein